MKIQLRILRVIACLLAAILLVLAYQVGGRGTALVIFAVLAIGLPIGLFPISKASDDHSE